MAATAVRVQNEPRDDYSGVVLSSSAGIRQLRDSAGRLTQHDDPMLDLEFFLASMSKGWKPRVVAVYSAGELVGILYAKERVVSDIVPTGIAYSDGSLGGFLLAHPLHQETAFPAAVRALLASPGIRGVRLRLSPDSEVLGSIRQLTASKSFDVQVSRIDYQDSPLWKYHAHLLLPGSYEQFLKNLGKTTRRDFRYYRRRCEASGYAFVESLSIDELRSAAVYLASKSKFGSISDIESPMNIVAAAPRPLAIGLRHHNGEWLSVLGGWYGPGGAVLRPMQ